MASIFHFITYPRCRNPDTLKKMFTKRFNNVVRRKAQRGLFEQFPIHFVYGSTLFTVCFMLKKIFLYVLYRHSLGAKSLYVLC